MIVVIVIMEGIVVTNTWICTTTPTIITITIRVIVVTYTIKNIRPNTSFTAIDIPGNFIRSVITTIEKPVI